MGVNLRQLEEYRENHSGDWNFRPLSETDFQSVDETQAALYTETDESLRVSVEHEIEIETCMRLRRSSLRKAMSR